MNPHSKITNKLLLYIILFSGLISLIITGVQLLFEFNRDTGTITSRLNTIEQTSRPGLTEAVWLTNKEQVYLLARGMLKNEDVEYVEIATTEGQVYKVGNANVPNVLIRTFPLEYLYADKMQKIAVVIVKASLDSVYSKLYERVWFVLVSNSLKTSIVAVFIYFAFHMLLVRHLYDINRFIKSLALNKQETLSLHRKSGTNPDELDVLVSSINRMTFKLNESVSNLARSEQQNRLLLESIAEAVYGIDCNGMCVFVNPACVEMLRFDSESELLGKNMHDLIHHSFQDGNSHPIERCRIGACIRDGAYVHVTDEVFWKKDATCFPVEYRAQPTWRDGKIIGAVISFFDITDKVQTLNALNEARRQAESANIAKSVFMANMSHEIRTPMNGILGMTQLALDSNPDAKLKHYLEQINTASGLLLGIINDVLDFSKIDAGKLDIEYLGFSLDSVIENVRNLTCIDAQKKGLDLQVTKIGNFPNDIVGDRLRLNQVLLNLVSNAVKFTESGSVILSIEAQESSETENTLLFKITDTGIGITEREQQNLFTAFMQADSSSTRNYGGTGLGLVISQRLVELMGGKILVDSAPGVGSTFYFSLRFASEVQRSSQHIRVEHSKQIRDTVAATSGGCRILLVEDNIINQEVAVNLLEKVAIHVDVAENGKEALDVLHGSIKYDGVLLDVQMPVMDGYETAQALRQDARYSSLPIIAMTANAMQGDREKCLAAGMDDYVSKPVNPDELYKVLSRWVSADPKPVKRHEMSSGRKFLLELSELPSIPGIDLRTALVGMDNDRALLQQLLVMFRDGHANFVEQFTTARSNGDYDGAVRLAHTLKSVSGTLGAEDLRASAMVLEQIAGIDGQDDAISIILDEIQKSLAPILKGIDAMAA